MNKKLFTLVLVLCVVIGVVASVSANEEVVTVVSDTNVMVYGPAMQYAPPGGAIWGTPKPAVETFIHREWPHGYTSNPLPIYATRSLYLAILDGANWLGSSYWTEPPYQNDTWRWFSREVELCPDAHNITGTIWATADNIEEVYVNRVFLGSNNNYHVVTTYPFTVTSSADELTLDFIVKNLPGSNDPQGNPTGLIFKAEIFYDCGFPPGGAEPEAIDDNYSVTEDAPLSIAAPGVLSNDVDLDGDNLFVSDYTHPNNGSVTLNPDGSFIYVPNDIYCGQDAFTYSASDGRAISNIATVILDVACVNDLPVINVEEALISVDEGLLATNRGSYSDEEDDTASLLASVGSVSIGNDGGDLSAVLLYENDFLDLQGWDYHGLVAGRCGSPIEQRDSVIYNSGWNRSGYVALPQPIITDQAQAFKIEVKFRYNDDGGMYIGLLKDNSAPCVRWGNDGVVFATGGEREDVYMLILPYGGSYQLIREPATHDGLWHIARLERSNEGYWSLFVDDRLIGTTTAPDFDTQYRYLSVDSYAGEGVNEIDWIKVYALEEQDNRWTWNYLTVDGPSESQQVSIFADDGNGGIGVGEFGLIVNNVAPAISAISALQNPVHAGSQVDLKASFSDPGILDTHTSDWDWGDGSTSAGVVDESNGSGTAWGNHVYTTPGLYTVTVTITDKDGDADDDQLTVEVLNRPPVCGAAYPSRSILWPVNHKFSAVEVLGVTDPEGDATSVTILSIYQDEPVNTQGDGQFSPDGMGIGTSTAEVRAERSGSKQVPGNGRVYHITFAAADGHGGTCTGTVFVGVPHDKKDTPVDDGPLYDSTATMP